MGSIGSTYFPLISSLGYSLPSSELVIREASNVTSKYTSAEN